MEWVITGWQGQRTAWNNEEVWVRCTFEASVMHTKFRLVRHGDISVQLSNSPSKKFFNNWNFDQIRLTREQRWKKVGWKEKSSSLVANRNSRRGDREYLRFARNFKTRWHDLRFVYLKTQRRVVGRGINHTKIAYKRTRAQLCGPRLLVHNNSPRVQACQHARRSIFPARTLSTSQLILLCFGIRSHCRARRVHPTALLGFDYYIYGVLKNERRSKKFFFDCAHLFAWTSIRFFVSFNVFKYRFLAHHQFSGFLLSWWHGPPNYSWLSCWSKWTSRNNGKTRWRNLKFLTIKT